ncbi:hypothetical protein PENTCL1PPCAC_1148, partial [Pristionchus entomophagus]
SLPPSLPHSFLPSLPLSNIIHSDSSHNQSNSTTTTNDTVNNNVSIESATFTPTHPWRMAQERIQMDEEIQPPHMEDLVKKRDGRVLDWMGDMIKDRLVVSAFKRHNQSALDRIEAILAKDALNNNQS